MPEPTASTTDVGVSALEAAGLVAVPLASLFVAVLLLRVVFKPKGEHISRKCPNYGAVPSSPNLEEDDIIYAGQVSGNYTAPWTATFDLVFLLSMVLSFVVLVVCTCFVRPDLWVNALFWQGLAFHVGGMLVVSTIGGLVCRGFGIINEKGYLLATISATFKVNYTRKCQHFAAYALPLLNPWSIEDNDTSQLPLLWSYFSILLCFLLLIKPLRERLVWCMVQFNGLDRPDDRPHTLKWLVVGNLAPGFLLGVAFNALFGATPVLLLVVAIAIVGDALAEPVGAAWGRHKYAVASIWSSTRRYTRSWEGSAAVFVSTMALIVLGQGAFDSMAQVWAAMAVLPPLVAYAEAVAPHTFDTPVLLAVSGGVVFGILQLVR